MSMKYNPETAQLDEEEQYYEDHYEEFTAADSSARAALIAAAKREPVILSERKQMVSIRLAPADITAIKQQAAKMGFAYQALISALLHQYAQGDLINVSDAKKLLKAK
jgi:predicted DNA binding CopG/RHH family protein